MYIPKSYNHPLRSTVTDLNEIKNLLKANISQKFLNFEIFFQPPANLIFNQQNVVRPDGMDYKDWKILKDYSCSNEPNACMDALSQGHILD